jgi:F-type H+-transporting ATPase subunit b
MEFLNESFVGAIAFGIFVVLVYKPVKNLLISMVDEYTAQAIKKLEEAEAIFKEAKAMSLDVQKQYNQAKIDSVDIMKRAKLEAASLIEDARKEVETMTAKKTEMAMERISQQEKQMVEDLKKEAVTLAISTVEQGLLKELDKSAQNSLINYGIKEIKKLIH